MVRVSHQGPQEKEEKSMPELLPCSNTTCSKPGVCDLKLKVVQIIRRTEENLHTFFYKCVLFILPVAPSMPLNVVMPGSETEPCTN